MGSFIARGEGSFIAQEGRSSRQRRRESKGKKKGTDAAAGGGGVDDGAGSGDDVISEGVESKRPELMIVQVDNEQSCTGSVNSREEMMAHPSESSRHDSIEV